ncbi:hypothetical protein GCM10022268_13140 [Sphingomonas cynarae]|uniref:Uncharacterized protein n=1 Tax=Sphingomonas cynarae TaxID=930197 RepID=A0ABP7DK32_9SPHN
MFATKFCLSVVTATLLTTAAAAAEPRDAPTATMTPAPTTIPATRAVADKGLSQRYCIVGDITASRILRRDCATLAEWQVLGVDPRRMPRR